jgi:FixJ family two-component response regulator
VTEYDRTVSQHAPASPLRVAIVDDEEAVRVSLRRLCQSLDMHAVAYACGVHFLDDLHAHRADPDCLLLDAHMPQMTGLDVQHELVALGVRFPTVVYSADDEPEALDRYIAAGAVAYLRKPLRGELLIAAIERAVASR